MKSKFEIIFENFQKAVRNLENVVNIASDDVSIDASLKRFELCYELSWKVIKFYLEYLGIFCRSPRECFKYAVLNGLIRDELVWLEMIDDRNLLVHTYTMEESRVVFDKIKSKYLQQFITLRDSILEKLR